MNPVKTAHTLDLVRRARRLRRTSGIRSYVRETRLSAEQFLYPLFVVPGSGVRREVPSMPGVFQLSVDEAVRETEAARADGVPGVLLFGLPSKKDDIGSAAYDADAPVQSAVRAIKRSVARHGRRHRRLPVRIHVARPLRHSRRPRRGERRDGRTARARGGVARRGRRRHRRAVGHDGRPRGRDSKGARRARLRRRRDHVVRREVLLGVLRPVPRSRRLGSAVRRPAHASDGSRPMPKKRCARSSRTSRRAPTSSW